MRNQESTTILSPTGQYQLFAAGPYAGLAEHEHAFGRLDPGRYDADLITTIDQAGLTGRGGAAFATWQKLASAGSRRNTVRRSPRPVVIGNGAEGEPLSFKDKTLLTHSPHLVIDGLLLVARAVSAATLFLYVTPSTRASVTAALAQRRDAGSLKLHEAPETFISGQSSAVVNALETGKAIPRDTSTHLSQSGYKQRPTLVLNVETLAHIGLIGRYGPQWFRSAGTSTDPGTRLVSISGMGTEEVLEIAGGALLGEVLISSGINLADVGAVLVGGYHGRWVSHQAVPTITLAPGPGPGPSVHPGAGVLLVLPTGACGLDVTSQILTYLAQASAKQCGPCTYGLPAIAQTMGAVAAGNPSPLAFHELQRLSGVVQGRGACHHPDGTTRMLSSALETFADDLQSHRTGSCTSRKSLRS